MTPPAPSALEFLRLLESDGALSLSEIGDPRERPGPDEPDYPTHWVTRTVFDPETGKPMMRRDDRWVVAQWHKDHPYEPYDPSPAWARRKAPEVVAMLKKSMPAPKTGTRDVDPELLDWCPSPFGFMVRVTDKKPFPGRKIGMVVVGHKETNQKDLFRWLAELAQSAGKSSEATEIERSTELSYQELTSKGSLGPALKQFQCGPVVRLFDEIVGFLTMVERDPEVADKFMKGMRGQLMLTGDVRWTLLKYVG